MAMFFTIRYTLCGGQPKPDATRDGFNGGSKYI
jgi:hypothetical protein